MKITKIFIALFFILCSINSSYAEQASADFYITLPEYMDIKTVNSSVLIANITDRTGNLYSPLQSKFRIISNSNEKKILYLKSKSITENGDEDSMFSIGNLVYIAFTNATKIPTSQALHNCKIGSHPKESPGVVAYPITSIIGAKSKYKKGSYEIAIENGITDLTVNVGSHVLKNSFDSNDPNGFYKATLSLTESDI